MYIEGKVRVYESTRLITISYSSKARLAVVLIGIVIEGGRCNELGSQVSGSERKYFEETSDV